jgi:propanol-preferring alcohol dehydrogenase
MADSYAAIAVAPDGSLESVQRPLVDPEPGQVRIRVEACGICHTDGLGIQPHDGTAPGRVPGHEIIGRVDAIGAGVRTWHPGDRVGAGFLGGACGRCEQCRMGNPLNCTDQPTTGVTVDGGYAEFAYVRESGVVAIPEELDARIAAPLVCAGFTVFNALVKAQPRPGSLVAVQGIGGLGHLGIQYARRMGMRVAAVARGTEKRELALKLGAHHYVDSAASDPGAALTELGGADLILATAASGSSMTPLIPGLAYGGQLMVVGASFEPIEVTPIALSFGGVQLAGSLTGTPGENEANLRFAMTQDVAPMIETVPLADAQKAYDRMKSGEARFRMVLDLAA